MAYRYRYKGALKDAAERLTRTDHLDGEIRTVRLLLVKHIHINEDKLLLDHDVFDITMQLLNRLTKLCVAGQKIRSQRAVSPQEKAAIFQKIRALVVNYLPRPAIPAFQEQLQSHQAMPALLPATVQIEGESGELGVGVEAFLRDADGVDPDAPDAQELSSSLMDEELILVRSMLATLLESHGHQLTQDMIGQYDRDLYFDAKSRFEQLIELLKVVERAAVGHSQVKSWQEQTREELLLWAGSILSVALYHIPPERLHGFAIAVRKELGVRLGDLTAMVELKERHGVWTDGSTSAARTLMDGD